MTKTYVVSYDFNASADQYQALFAELTRFPAWWHFINGTWLVATDLDAQGIFSKLQPHIDEEVNLLILEAGNDCAGWLPKKAWEWIANQRAKAVPDPMPAHTLSEM